MGNLISAYLKRDTKEKTVELVAKVDDVTDLIDNTIYSKLLEAIAKRYVDEYYTDIIKRIDPKRLAALVAVEAAKKAVRE